MERRRSDSQDGNPGKRHRTEAREDAGWGPTHRGRGSRGWGRDGQGRGFMTDGRGRYGRGDFGPIHHDRGAGWQRIGGHAGGFPNDAPFMHPLGHPGAHNVMDAQHQLPMPPQQQHADDAPAFHGHQQGMHGDGAAMPDAGHPGQYQGGGSYRGRGRGWGRGGASGGAQPFRRGQGMLDPAVLERRRKSTAAIVARQLAPVHVSESLAGQKGYMHYQRTVSAIDDQEGGVKEKLSEEEMIKRSFMYSAVASEENASCGARAQDPLDAYELCLDEYMMTSQEGYTTGRNLTLQTSKYGTFLAPPMWQFS
ncbi:hypothetical protein COCOBI_03-4080 [Coccomyxa sp. Obi]|nr:hypothetical protein COCOBI_03-4080 [Coccomyxa sp. Obi]